MRNVIKCKFLAPSSHIYGIMLIVLAEETLNLEDLRISLSTYSLDYNALTPDSSVENYLEILKKKKKVLSFEKIVLRLRSALKKDLKVLENDGKRTKRKDIIEIEDFLKNVIRKCTVVREIIIFTSLEELSTDRYEDLFKRQEENEALLEDSSDSISDDVLLKIPESSLEVKSSLILSPVGGTPIFDIKIGHSIFVEIEEGNAQDAKESKQAKIIRTVRPAVVAGAQFSEGVHTFLLSLGNNEFSLVNETENIKVKMLSDELHKKIDEKTNKKKISQLPITYFFFILLFFIIIFFFVVAFIWVV